MMPLGRLVIGAWLVAAGLAFLVVGIILLQSRLVSARRDWHMAEPWGDTWR